MLSNTTVRFAIADAIKQLEPVHTRFALDATYFSERDPTRGIIMACAAWETALRNYLANVAVKRDPAYDVAADSRSIPLLRKFAEAAKGCALLQDAIDQSTGAVKEQLEYTRRMLDELPKLRNKLLHRGEMEVSTTNARAGASAVLTQLSGSLALPSSNGTTAERARPPSRCDRQ